LKQEPTDMNGTTSRRLLILIHVAVAVSVLGVDVVLIALGLAGYTTNPETTYPAAQLIGQRVLWPLALASLATGVTVALVGPYGLFRFWWVTIKLLVTLALTGLLAFVLLPALTAAAQAAAAGEALAESRQLMLVLGPIVSSALLLTNIALAVFKPTWRLAQPPRRSEVTA
jgi:hypothetical protein